MTKKLTTQEFVEKAKLKHGNRYEYDKTEHRSYAYKLTIFANDAKNTLINSLAIILPETVALAAKTIESP